MPWSPSNAHSQTMADIDNDTDHGSITSVRASPRPQKLRCRISATGTEHSTVPPTTAAVHSSVRMSASMKIGSAKMRAKFASPTKPRTWPKRDTSETDRRTISYSG